jgi:hypothetical protein
VTARKFKLSLALCDFGSYDHAADINVFDGFGYSTFQPVHVSIDQVAALSDEDRYNMLPQIARPLV